MTSWQDIVLMLGNMIFIFGVAQILRAPMAELRPPLSASIPTGVTLLVYSAVFLTLGLYFSAIASMMTGLCWLIVAIQRDIQ